MEISKEERMWDEMMELNDKIIFQWEKIRDNTIKVKKLEQKYIMMDEAWQEYSEVCSNDKTC
tara:strand:+ start:164 stop:349 length:186 start_codon:yes stop_codon:yes gene_type:complete